MFTLKKYALWFALGYGLLYYAWLYFFSEQSFILLIDDNSLFLYMCILFYSIGLTYLLCFAKNFYAPSKFIFNSIIMTVTTTITYQYVILPLLFQEEVSLFYIIASIGYPLGHLVLLFAGITLYMGKDPILPKKSMELICMGLITQALTNLLYTYIILNGHYAFGSYLDPLWPLAFIFIAVSRFVDEEVHTSKEIDEKNIIYFSAQDKFRVFLPYVSVIFLLVLLILQQENVSVLFIGFSVTIALIIIRQVIILFENQSLVEELYLLNRDLEKKVELKTQELAKTNDELVTANQYKDDIITSMSHELRTPIHVILSYIELIEEEDGPIPASAKADLDVIRRSTKRLLLIIDNLVYLAKVHKPSKLLELERICIKDIIYHIYEDFFYMAEEKGLDFILDIKDLDKATLFDQLKLQQILSNLVMNAIKFTEKGYIKISAFMENDWLTISVEDTGIGIPQEYYDRIFEKFVQVDRGISRKYGGAGIGLTIVKNLVDLLDGSIHLESTLHKGTKFTVQFPLGPYL